MCVRYTGKSIGHYLFVTVGKSKAKTMTEEKCSGRAHTHIAGESELHAANGREAGKKPNKRTYTRIKMKVKVAESEGASER